VVPAAEAAPPLPFGHACTPQEGVLFCPTASDDQRVPSFDGIPLDVDVTLPAAGDGPFPTIVILHGFGGSKTDFEAANAEGLQPNGSVKATAIHNNNVFYAQRGYAVVNYSARGFGRSCGRPDSRTSPGCDRGWFHLADQRYEARDTQHLLGLLVDQGVARADALGVTGESYGGGQTQMLARLRDRVLLPSGGFAPWTSPNGTPLAIAAAWSRWGWSDLLYSLLPNGRFLEFRASGRAQSRSPVGVKKESFLNGLFLLANLTGFLAPAGADPGADLRSWKRIVDRGEPYGRAALVAARELATYHSPSGLPGGSAPILLQNGWRDELFPVHEALRAYNELVRLPGARVALQVGDVGHSQASNKPGINRAFNDQAAAWFDALMKGSGAPLPNGTATAFITHCPRNRPDEGPISAPSWRALRRGGFAFGGRRAQRVTARGGNPATGFLLDKPLSGDVCSVVRRERARGTAVYQRRPRRSFTMMGLPTVRATVRTRGRGGYLAARLWNVLGPVQRLMSRGVYRLRPNQRGRITFQLFGNAYRVGPPPNRVKLELLGRDPNYLRTSNKRFSVRVSRLRVELPTRDRRPR
jgi:predicted esterase